MKTAYLKTSKVLASLRRVSDEATFEDAHNLRRAEMTLHRWAEQECGDGDDYKSWSIERDEATGKPFLCIYPHNGTKKRYPTPDREKGALLRVAAICKRLNLSFHYQTDPRGCALYVGYGLTPSNYSNGIAVCA
jgi:hypothetical protein